MEPLGPIVADKMGSKGPVAAGRLEEQRVLAVAGRMEPLGPAVGRSGLPERVVGTTERLEHAVDKTGLELQGPVAGMMVMRKLVVGMTEPLEHDVAVDEMRPMEKIVGTMEPLVLAAGTMKLLELVAGKKEPNGTAAGKTEQVVDRLEEQLGLVAGRAKQIANVAGKMTQLLNEFQYSHHHNLSWKMVMLEGELSNRHLKNEARILFQSNNE
jgi:hypothetical protein